MTKQYSKYFKDVSGLSEVDVYRVLEMFGVTSHALGHAVKKVLLPGERTGGKTLFQDVIEARDTLDRWLEMRVEDKELTDAEAFGTAARHHERLLHKQKMASANWDEAEARMLPIAQNGNTGEHYNNANPLAQFIGQAPEWAQVLIQPAGCRNVYALDGEGRNHMLDAQQPIREEDLTLLLGKQ